MLKKYNLEIMTVIFFGTFTICAVFGSQLGLIQRIMLGYMFLFTLHEWEETRFPGGFADLMPKMTHATLSVQLKSLVDSGLVERVQYEDIPPRVEYSLTDIGKKFHPVVEAMKTWGEEYIKAMK